jgi:Uma2 family endonuclease
MTPKAGSSALLELLPAAGEWTEADYFPLSERGRLVELSDGEIEVVELPTDFHQLILLRLCFAVHAYVSASRLGQVRFAPLPVRLWPGKIREPDLIYMSAGHADRIGKFWGVPDLAVEILSEGTAHTDREIKRDEYAAAGISEYWIVDPEAKTVALLVLDETAGAYRLAAVPGTQDFLTSALFPGFSLSLTDLFAEEALP